ncbi:Aly2p NDAI_0G05570 [Naumovozyma dairenensis CBS 421]|uniref:Arrestin C-terminal-like domain-containing protein n=1 Tax=Naumovozyma dairenensis (strain ATCC 10597 / BCRC 20456 / CBS 421 / NBRC 0211 / NRRL Y-12639) TaxID=1071378 RepID=J7SBT1_NAUDC|nr:hypothetical protein NDAI_0G05570 [Naumovozyma dairenensis CBS 421]CCK73540.1 hypothetical protein NDAI_0G05570 [Naumovozyma dairenensis CBS 421]
MTQLHSVLSPVFPAETSVEITGDCIPLAETSSIQLFIKLAEPKVFLQGFESRHISEKQPSILRGSLIVRVLKPTRIKNISLSFKGYSRTEWPEGIPPKRQDFVEINDIINHTWPFYQTDHNVTATSGNPVTSTNDKLSQSGNNKVENMLLKKSGASVYRKLPNSSKRSSSVLLNHSNNNSSSNLTASTTHNNNNNNNNNNLVSPNGTVSPSLRNSRNRATSNASRSSSVSRSLSPMALFRRAATIPSENINSSTNTTRSHNNNHNHNNIHNTNERPTHSHSSLISDLFNSTFSSASLTDSSANTNNNTSDSNNTLNDANYHHHFIFQTGDYIYAFEQLISQSYPETIKADFGFVEYFLYVSVERYGAFKSNITARLPIQIIRTQSDTSVEESEPITISRDWENQLFYDIVIASKDIILDAFLPITFKFSPLDKVTLHRVRIYVTETMEYYCNGKKIHRMEPTKKFLLAEHRGPRLPTAPPEDPNHKSKSKAKYMGNLLEDPVSGDLINKDFEFQVYVPTKFGNHQQLHPDSTYEKIKSNHWIKICLRLSKMVEDKRKHYEISIDSPIHVLHKLCSHANTLLPSYESHILSNTGNLDDPSSNLLGNESSNDNIYHNSNVFFPKEILLSPVLSPGVHPLDQTAVPNNNPQHQSINAKRPNYSRTRSQQSLNDTSNNDDDKISMDIFNSPKLKSNIYHPDSIQRELASPQAIPLSPIVSPNLRPLSLALSDIDADDNFDRIDGCTNDTNDPPPSFDFSSDSTNEPNIHVKTTTLHSSSESSKTDLLPRNPPSYVDVLKKDGIKSIEPSVGSSILPRITLNRSQESIVSLPHNHKYHPHHSSKLQTRKSIKEQLTSSSAINPTESISSNTKNEDWDIASNFNFHGTNLPSGILRNTAAQTNQQQQYPLRRNSIQDILPSTLRNDNRGFSDLNQILDEDKEDDHEQNYLQVGGNSSDIGQSSSTRSSFDRSSIIQPLGQTDTQPLLGSTQESLMSNSNVSVGSNYDNTNYNSLNVFDATMNQSRTSMSDICDTSLPLDSSVDMTALYDRNPNVWHPLQLNDENDNNGLSPMLRNNFQFDNFKDSHSDDRETTPKPEFPPHKRENDSKEHNDDGRDDEDDDDDEEEDIDVLHEDNGSSSQQSGSINRPSNEFESKNIINNIDGETLRRSYDDGILQ